MSWCTSELCVRGRARLRGKRQVRVGRLRSCAHVSLEMHSGGFGLFLLGYVHPYGLWMRSVGGKRRAKRALPKLLVRDVSNGPIVVSPIWITLLCIWYGCFVLIVLVRNLFLVRELSAGSASSSRLRTPKLVPVFKALEICTLHQRVPRRPVQHRCLYILQGFWR